MGWITCNDTIASKKGKSIHIEFLKTPQIIPKQLSKTHEFAPIDLPDDKLLFVPSTEVRKRLEQPNGELWLVVDNIVYDCTEFALEHPGGAEVLASFCGKDCSWQFWRFHNEDILLEFGRLLRIGRTEGIENPFPELPRFVGAKKLFMASDDD
jgi:cytochrome b involved in lipid metabolism